MTTPTILESKKKEFLDYLDGRIEFLFDHWLMQDKPPYTFGGWREEVKLDIYNWIITNFQPEDEK